MKEGWLSRSFKATLSNDIQVSVKSLRFLSLVHEQIGAIRYEVTPLNRSACISFEPFLDGNIKNKESKALFLSVWDSEKKESLRIDLWTKEMPLDEMKIFFHQTLVAMSDTFNRATQDEKMTATFKDFCDYFADKLDLKQK
jgi:gliding motility-associated protein GldC